MNKKATNATHYDVNNKSALSQRYESRSEESIWLVNLSENIKEKRKERKLSQVYLAKKLGISVNSLKAYEKAEHYPNALILGRIAYYFDTTPDELLGIRNPQVKQDRLLPWLSCQIESSIKLLVEAKKKIDEQISQEKCL